MTFHELESCWAYFLSLEGDLNNTSRFVEPNGQANVFSFEFFKIITLSCTEIETAFKEICKTIRPEATPGDIGEYKSIVLGKYLHICSAMVIVPR